MNVAIIGAGWFGCHIAKSLLSNGVNVTVFEKNKEVFSEASKYNTGRLHLGFHYPRSEKTRKQSKEGFSRFISEYGNCSEALKVNLYLVAEKESLLDFETYCSILKSAGLDFEVVNPVSYGFRNIEGGLLCKERAINPIKAARYFEKQLAEYLRLNTLVHEIEATDKGIKVNGQVYAYCINCSYCSFEPGAISEDICYEYIETLLFKPKNSYAEKAFVLMDGNFFSVNPYYAEADKHLFSLYHVRHSVISSSSSYNEIRNSFKTLQNKPLENKLDLDALMADVHRYYPGFRDEFKPAGSFGSIRTRLVNENANRECIVQKNDSLITVLSGKINSIFEAEERVMAMLSE